MFQGSPATKKTAAPNSLTFVSTARSWVYFGTVINCLQPTVKYYSSSYSSIEKLSWFLSCFCPSSHLLPPLSRPSSPGSELTTEQRRNSLLSTCLNTPNVYTQIKASIMLGQKLSKKACLSPQATASSTEVSMCFAGPMSCKNFQGSFPGCHL